MSKKHILLVDDEIDFAETLALRLQLRGYEVSVVHSGEEALLKVQEKPDLILLDVMMPTISGYEVCRRLRQDSQTKYIPIIMLTAKSMPKDKVEGLQIGADDYITKSFDVEELFARIEALLRRSALSKQILREQPLLIEELKQIIQSRSVEINFQPIFYLKSYKLFAYEVLSRPPQASKIKGPENLFQCALNCGMLFELEMMCRKKALVKIGDLIEKRLFFFNNSPYLIESEKIKDVLAIYKQPQQIILELTERTEIKDFSNFCQTLSSFRAQGFKISIDDIGSGYSSLDSIAELEPDFIKISMNIIRNIDSNKKKQNLVKTITSLCKQNSIVSIAEGIETEAELQTVMNLGADAGQGFLLGKPSPRFLRVDEK
jgi:EAL domain-containing protein (putative c-di-GMP-specific phosphodiesterase class I)